MAPAVPLLIRIWVATACSMYAVEQATVLGVIAQESMFESHALGCYDGQGEPHCFGLMQLHDRGAGYMIPPRILLQPLPNVLIGVYYMAGCQSAYPQRLNWQLACYQQGLEGARIRGLGPSYEYIRWATYYRDLFEREGIEHGREKSGYQDPF